LHRNKNVDVVFNDTDKNVGPACADKDDVINESTRQLYEKRVYNQLTKEEAEQLIRVLKKRLENVVNKHMIKGFCSKKRTKFSTFEFEQIQSAPFLYHLENFEKSNRRQTHSGWVQLDTFSSFDIRWTLFKSILHKVRLYSNG
jgi:hypothetical protein